MLCKQNSARYAKSNSDPEMILRIEIKLRHFLFHIKCIYKKVPQPLVVNKHLHNCNT